MYVKYQLCKHSPFRPTLTLSSCNMLARPSGQQCPAKFDVLSISPAAPSIVILVVLNGFGTFVQKCQDANSK